MRGRMLSASFLLPALAIGAWTAGVSGQGGGSYTKEQIARGEFLVTIGGCHDCHTPKVFTAKGPEPDMTRMLAGAPANVKVPAVPPGVISPTGWGALGSNDMTTWAGPWGISFASNLTPDKTTGLGNWTEASFIRAMKTGKHKGTLRDLLPPMPWQGLAKLSDDDLRSLFAYLRSLKPIQNKVSEPIPPAAK